MRLLLCLVLFNGLHKAGITFAAHDLRRIAAAVVAECAFSRDSIGKRLNHLNQSVAEGSIQRKSGALRPILLSIEDGIAANYMVDLN